MTPAGKELDPCVVRCTRIAYPRRSRPDGDIGAPVEHRVRNPHRARWARLQGTRAGRAGRCRSGPGPDARGRLPAGRPVTRWGDRPRRSGPRSSPSATAGYATSCPGEAGTPGGPIGTFIDDTQQSVWTARSLLAAQTAHKEVIATALAEHRSAIRRRDTAHRREIRRAGPAPGTARGAGSRWFPPRSRGSWRRGRSGPRASPR